MRAGELGSGLASPSSPSPLIVFGATGSVSVSLQLLLRPTEFQRCVEPAQRPRRSAVSLPAAGAGSGLAGSAERPQPHPV